MKKLGESITKGETVVMNPSIFVRTKHDEIDFDQNQTHIIAAK